MSTLTAIDTQTIYLRVVLDEPTEPPTVGGFAEQFLNLESLIFVSALIAIVQPKYQISPENLQAVVADPTGYWSNFELPPPPIGEANPMFSPEAIDAADKIVALFRIVGVTYASPVDILMALMTMADDHTGPIAVAGGVVLSTAGALILLWSKFSKARESSAQADVAVAHARIMNANAREAEARAGVTESEAALRIEANHLIRDHLGITRSIFGADSPMSNRTASGPDPKKSVKALEKQLDQAVCALINIESAEFKKSR